MKGRLEPRQMEILRQSLDQRGRELREQIRQTLIKSDSEQYRQIAAEVHELEDDSFADLMVDVNLAEVDRELEELRGIDAAMLRMSDGSYGTCEECGLKIDFERLQAAPFAMRCFTCQSVHERTHYSRQGHTL
jgi:RNA polymerase-binding protein DksA